MCANSRHPALSRRPFKGAVHRLPLTGQCHVELQVCNRNTSLANRVLGYCEGGTCHHWLWSAACSTDAIGAVGRGVITERREVCRVINDAAEAQIAAMCIRRRMKSIEGHELIRAAVERAVTHHQMVLGVGTLGIRGWLP